VWANKGSKGCISIMKEYMKIIDIAKALNLTPDDLKLAYNFWVAEEGFSSMPQKQVTTIDNITTAIDRDESLKFLYKQAQILLGKTLNATDVQILYSFYDDYGFPANVAVMLITHAIAREKRNMKYIEKIAIEWAEKGILTVEDAENHIKKREQLAKRENKIRQALGIERKLTQTEEQFIRSWANEMKVPLELVPIAYERTINGTGKLSCAYMDKIFKNWMTAGIKTAEQLSTHEADYKSKQTAPQNGTSGTVKPSKFNNFAGTSGIDYAAAAKQKMNRG